MSPQVFACVLCGWVILDAPGRESWLNQFRGLYSGPTGIVLTGVGLYDDPERCAFIAPADYNARWDDPDYHSPEADQFGAMRQPPINDRHGFIFHDACWCLLQKASAKAVPRERLFNVLKSLPIPIGANTVSWGHDYGGLTPINRTDYFPWEDWFHIHNEVEPDPVWNANPYDIPEVEQVITGIPQSPPGMNEPITRNLQVGTDPFSGLPQELCAAIAIALPTRDVLNLRHASKAFWPIFYSEQFWASRFQHISERAWLFEARNGRHIQDWRWLYHQTSSFNNSAALQNRIRIWKLLQTVLDLSYLDCTRLPGQSVCSSQLNTVDSIEVAGDILEEYSQSRRNPFDGGCRLFYKDRIAIPRNVSRVSVSYVQVGDRGYVTGLKFITSSGDTVQSGYWGWAEDSVAVKEITGFHLGVDSRGIQAIQCISEGTDVSRWLGYPDDCPKTRRLAMPGCLESLELGFDGFKLISLSASQRSLSSTKMLSREDQLRNLSLWYPDVLPSSMSLSKSIFPARDDVCREYKPLFWLSFGGPGGSYLRNLVRISALCGEETPQRLDFFYNNQNPIERQSFSRHFATEFSNTMDFAIDGPGGEIINAVEVEVLHYDPSDTTRPWIAYMDGDLVACTIYTNRGRYCRFACDDDDDDPSDLVSISMTAAPGKTITGFFGTQSSNDGQILTSLGVISELVEQY
ncbi:hypothetical protein F4810DRAFT_677085 [Camillea tinctor]|nr:hypothetical protein F4810DRAFT_677085 [Camillea tinctor]